MARKNTKNTQKHTKTCIKHSKKHTQTHRKHTQTRRNCAKTHKNSARSHFGATWLAETSARGHFGVTWRSSGSRKLASRSLRGHLAQENLARSHFEVAATAATAATATVWRLFKKHLKNICGNSSSKRLGLKVTLRHSALLAITRGWISSGSH